MEDCHFLDSKMSRLNKKLNIFNEPQTPLSSQNNSNINHPNLAIPIITSTSLNKNVTSSSLSNSSNVVSLPIITPNPNTPKHSSEFNRNNLSLNFSNSKPTASLEKKFSSIFANKKYNNTLEETKDKFFANENNQLKNQSKKYFLIFIYHRNLT